MAACFVKILPIKSCVPERFCAQAPSAERGKWALRTRQFGLQRGVGTTFVRVDVLAILPGVWIFFFRFFPLLDFVMVSKVSYFDVKACSYVLHQINFLTGVKFVTTPGSKVRSRNLKKIISFCASFSLFVLHNFLQPFLYIVITIGCHLYIVAI